MTSLKAKGWRATLPWVARAFRVGLASGVVLGAFGLVVVRTSYASAVDAAMNFGESLREMNERHAAGEVTSESYDVVVNGQHVQSSNAATSLQMHEVLDIFQAECKEDALGMPEKLGRLEETISHPTQAAGVPGFMVIRREQQDRGFVICMAADHELSSREQLLRLKSVGDSGDLSRIGDIRYVSAYKQSYGARVVAAWAHGTFNISKMFPKTGDAPGEDLGAVPRPDGGRRILTGTIAGTPYGINGYEVKGTTEEVMASLDAKLAAAGYKQAKLPNMVAASGPGRFYSLGNSLDVGVTATKSSRDRGLTNVSYVVSKGIPVVSR